MMYLKLVGVELVVRVFQSSVRLMKQCAPDPVGDHGFGTGRTATADNRTADVAAAA